MSTSLIRPGTIHRVPSDLRAALSRSTAVLSAWNSLTPLARNEWICWVTIVKKDTTRNAHIQRLCADLEQGKRRPCCWAGCPHRKMNRETASKEA